jgi:xanthine dehydrogenase YagS FAD-binding subunit
MSPFTYTRVDDQAVAVASALAVPGTQYLAGGTNLIDLMKEGVLRPHRLMDVWGVPMAEINVLPSGGVRVGANVKNAQAAKHPFLLATYPGLCEAILAGASQQIRGMASMAGNILQRTRCP